MEEIEVKIIEIVVGKTIERLDALGATKVFEGPLSTVHLDFANNELKKKGKMLRIRQKDGKCIITLKVKKKDPEAKVMDEFETEVKKPDEIYEIFSKLGLIVIAKDSKKRISYRLKNSLVEINTYEGIPPFLEVESPNKDEMKEIVGLLGYDMKDTRTWDGGELLEHYRKKKTK